MTTRKSNRGRASATKSKSKSTTTRRPRRPTTTKVEVVASAARPSVRMRRVNPSMGSLAPAGRSGRFVSRRVSNPKMGWQQIAISTAGVAAGALVSPFVIDAVDTHILRDQAGSARFESPWIGVAIKVAGAIGAVAGTQWLATQDGAAELPVREFGFGLAAPMLASAVKDGRAAMDAPEGASGFIRNARRRPANTPIQRQVADGGMNGLLHIDQSAGGHAHVTDSVVRAGRASNPARRGMRSSL